MRRDDGAAGVREIRVESLGALVDGSTPAAVDPASGRLRATVVFRGTRHARWPILTSLDRLGGVDPPHTKAHLEEHILRNFMRYSRPHLLHPTADVWELMVTAQHHGLPTRLLDWSYSPLVAAHFATLSDQPCDRVVWALDWSRVHARFGLPPVALLVEEMSALLARSGVATAWDLFARPDGAPAELVCMLDPPALDARIVAQAASFTVCTDKTRAFDQVLARYGLLDALTRFVIPAECVPRLRDQLDLVTMDERRLFPDLDGVAAEMRRYYDATAPRGQLRAPGQG